MKVKCIIVDDEPPARELLVSYLSKVEDFEIAGQFDNALDAFAYLQKHQTDLAFLDIQMPQMNGVELVKSLTNAPRIIFTTAFRKYATDGFDLDALDYLVKPITFDRFMKSIGKYHQYHSRSVNGESATEAFESAYIFVKVNKAQVRIYLKDIVFIESIRDYLKIHTREKIHVTYMRISFMQEKLPERKFTRIHKSFIVSFQHITAIRADIVEIGNRELPIGRHYKKSFHDDFLGKEHG